MILLVNIIWGTNICKKVKIETIAVEVFLFLLVYLENTVTNVCMYGSHGFPDAVFCSLWRGLRRQVAGIDLLSLMIA